MDKLPLELLIRIMESVHEDQDRKDPAWRTLSTPMKRSIDSFNTRIVIGLKKKKEAEKELGGRKRSKDRLDAVLRVIRSTRMLSVVHFMQMSDPRELDRILDGFSTRIDQITDVRVDMDHRAKPRADVLTLLRRCRGIRQLSVSMDDRTYTSGHLWRMTSSVSEAMTNIESLSISRLWMRNLSAALAPCAALKELTLHRYGASRRDVIFPALPSLTALTFSNVEEGRQDVDISRLSNLKVVKFCNSHLWHVELGHRREQPLERIEIHGGMLAQLISTMPVDEILIRDYDRKMLPMMLVPCVSKLSVERCKPSAEFSDDTLFMLQVTVSKLRIDARPAGRRRSSSSLPRWPYRLAKLDQVELRNLPASYMADIGSSVRIVRE